jgi:hypothetical protein
MRRWIAALAGVLFMFSTAPPALANSGDNAFLAGGAFDFGPRGGWGGANEPIVGGGPFLGARLGRWRLGANVDFSYWHAQPGYAVDVGTFVSYDILPLWLDRDLSAGLPVLRLDPNTFRWISSTTQWAWLPSIELGIRVVGVEIGVAGVLEYGLEQPPASESRVGWDLLFRLRLDGVELGHLIHHLCVQTPLAP